MENSALHTVPCQLLLPGASDGADDLDDLRKYRESLRGRPRADNTERSYASDWKSFAGWCALMGLSSLPASPETLANYVTWLLKKQRKKVSTAARHLASIACRHRRASLPVPSMGEAREHIATVKYKRRERPVGKRALAVDDLVKACESCEGSTVRGARDRAIIVLGFATSLRRSELARLDLLDVKLVDGDKLVVFVPFSKTDQEGAGRALPVWKGQRELTDPLDALAKWIAIRGRWPGPLFCPVMPNGKLKHKPLTSSCIADVVKAAVRRIGLDDSDYGAHSLRSGAVTASADIGRSDQEIRKLSGHATTQAMQMYVRNSGLFRGRNPLEGVL